MLSPGQRERVVVTWNRTEADYPAHVTLVDLLEAQGERSPHAPAVIFGGQQLTYAELHGRANQLARYLRERDVGRDTLVGICLERSLEMVIGLLGILKSGAAYVPLDPAYPRERLAFMMADAQAPVLLTQRHLLDTLPQHEGQTICLDADWPTISHHSRQEGPCPISPQDLAYVIYTSGSTADPRGP